MFFACSVSAMLRALYLVWEVGIEPTHLSGQIYSLMRLSYFAAPTCLLRKASSFSILRETLTLCFQ